MRSVLLAAAWVLWTSSLQAQATVYPVAPELQSDRFHITIAGQESPVAHAATTYYFFNFAVQGKTEISVTSDIEGYWNKGVEVQPWRWGIRPSVKGRTITFTVAEPMALSISRPSDHAAGAEMLFLFANAPETEPPRRGDKAVRYYGPGTYHENIDAKSGETIYLAPGAVVFGALNLWGVENVKVLGRGTMVYEGPQDPAHDEGWMHKPNWHVIGMDHAKNIQITGITFVVRSRTWMIQMLGSRHVTFQNIKVIGGCLGNANQDGMDWLGGGDTVIRDSFFRASDDIFALYGNWLGYGPEAITTPGETVDNILIENSVLSTSISNVVRVSWPGKVFDSHHFTMRNSDVIHMGMGGCKIPFGLLEIWDDPGGKGEHADYSFENVRLENWYSLLQLRQQNAGIQGVALKNIWALDTPTLVSSVLSGNVSGVEMNNVKTAGAVVTGDSDAAATFDSGAVAPAYRSGDGPHASMQFRPMAIRPGTEVVFDAGITSGQIKQYHWTFGDGVTAQGRSVRHRFPDLQGTNMDGSGRFRVLLRVTDANGAEDWSSKTLVVANDYAPALRKADTKPGVQYKYYEGHGLTLAKLLTTQPLADGTIATVSTAGRRRTEDYAFVFEGQFAIPADGGYTFFLLGNDAAELQIDSHVVAVSPTPKPQVCGMTGNMVQLQLGSVGLRAGLHAFRIQMTHSSGPDGFALKWQGPEMSLKALSAQ